MAIFRRKKNTSDPEIEDLETESGEVESEDPDGEPAPEVAAVRRYDRSEGPWDIVEQDRADGSIPRLDLGSLLIPGLPGLGLQVEADQQTQAVMAVTAMKEEAAVQLQAFAAPRSLGLWEEFRAEIKAEIEAGPGEITEVDGPFGRELRAMLPAALPDGRQGVQPVRFVGIDGPRWFLRAVFLGRAAVEPDYEDDLHHLVRQTIVVRGPDAMAPRDLLPLRLPQVNETGGDLAPELELEEELDESEDRYGDLNPFERGPEITEIR